MKPAPIKAWAVVDEDDQFSRFNESLAVFTTEDAANEEASYGGERVIPVLITPLTDEGQERKEK